MRKDAPKTAREPLGIANETSNTRGGHSVRCYNVIFPIWFLLLFPVAWLYALPANFIIDSIVLLLALHMLKLDE